MRGFVGAREGDEVVFTRNTTDSLNLLARALPRDTTMYVFETEHHAALLPWNPRRTVRLPVPGSAEDALSSCWSRRSRRRRPPTGWSCSTGASNVTGELWPVRRLVELAGRHGARVVLDAAQLAPHRAVDLDALGVDYVAFSGHKLYAPFGAGVLAGRADWLDAAAPYLAGGGATRAVTARAAPSGRPGRPGTRPAAPTSSARSRWRRRAPRCASTSATSRPTRTALATRLRRGPGADRGRAARTRCSATTTRGSAVAAFTVEGLDSSLVSAALSAEYGIGVRDGKFCAHLLVDALLDDQPPPATAVRASVGLANTAEHVDRLLAAVGHARRERAVVRTTCRPTDGLGARAGPAGPERRPPW